MYRQECFFVGIGTLQVDKHNIMWSSLEFFVGVGISWIKSKKDQK